MTSWIEQFQKEQREVELSKAWAAMIGAPFSGLGGGVGRVSSVGIGSWTKRPTIYFNESSDRNYHRIPNGLIMHLEAAIMDRFDELLADAIAKQEKYVKALAVAALEEHSELLRVALGGEQS